MLLPHHEHNPHTSSSTTQHPRTLLKEHTPWGSPVDGSPRGVHQSPGSPRGVHQSPGSPRGVHQSMDPPVGFTRPATKQVSIARGRKGDTPLSTHKQAPCEQANLQPNPETESPETEEFNLQPTSERERGFPSPRSAAPVHTAHLSNSASTAVARQKAQPAHPRAPTPTCTPAVSRSWSREPGSLAIRTRILESAEKKNKRKPETC